MNLDLLLSRIKERTRIDESTGCWLYTGGLDEKGYGRIRLGNYIERIHRISAHIYLKLDLNDKLQLALHKLNCPNKNCWNPEHLYIGDYVDNMRDAKILGHTGGGLAKTNKEKTHCLNGHPLSGDNLYIPRDGRRRCRACRINESRKS